MNRNYTGGFTTGRRLVPNSARHTARAEMSLVQIASRVADYRKLIRLDIGTDPRRRPRLWRPIEVRHGNTIVDLMSIIETFVSVLLLDLRPEVSPDNVSTWKKRQSAWTKHGSVDLTNYHDWSALLGFVEVRNALQHGLGKLTDRQLGDHRDEILGYIEKSGVHLNGDRLVLIERDVERCEHVCVDFVKWLDSGTPTS